MQQFDLFVLGTGPAGQRAAVQAAKLGKKVGICEKRQVVGGVCVNTGTIPSKTFREAVLYLSGIAQRAYYGASYSVKENITMEDLLLRCQQVITREIDVIRSQMKRNGIALLGGSAAFTDPHHLTVTGASGTLEVEAEKVVIAVGTKPAAPPVPVDGESVIDSDGILSLKRLPRSLLVVGAGVIGVEYASMFAALGIEVTIVDKRPVLLDFVDDEIAEALSFFLRKLNCTLRLGEEVATVAVERPGRVAATLKSGKKIASGLLLYSVGRVGATAPLNLAAAGLQADERGRLEVNEAYQTAQPHIYAVGDVIGFPALASTSMEQGRLASCHAFGVACESLPHLYPIGIYSVPEISMVGKTEEELTKEAVPYETGVAHYREIARGAIVGDDTGILKILVHAETRKLLGIHILGTAATELIHIGQSFLALGGTLDVMVDTVFNYPTFAECYKVAALDAYNKLRAGD
ncbi:MAG TPA: Si-specific NAD(P)(+) transhydrogenase [Thermoanaerobaculia bacterium]|nr:Si-specific NAD(P)(+) transhydrogenase [Thermoanaerobaculia bacterium]